jgi:4-hydroxy-tetrahydrodipicolinate synthase
VVAGLFPQPSAALTRAAMQGDATETARLDALFAPLWQLFKTYGSLRVVYAAAEHLKLIHARPPRPLLPLSADIMPALEAAIAGLED